MKNQEFNPENAEFKEIIGKKYCVLDHGFVRVVDYMGGDDSVVQAARVSYGKGTKSSRSDRALIRYLMRNRHSTPFEMAEIKFHVKLPIFVARQWIRHRTASVNEYSARYSILENESYVPELEAIAAQSSVNKQGRSGNVSDAEKKFVKEAISEANEAAYAVYLELLNEDENPIDTGREGMARELARTVLGVGFYTQWYWKIDLHNLLHFLELRTSEHAQYEIRQYANKILDILKLWMPVTYEAFVDYRLQSYSLSRQSLDVVRRLVRGEEVQFLDSDLSKREWEELVSVLRIHDTE